MFLQDSVRAIPAPGGRDISSVSQTAPGGASRRRRPSQLTCAETVPGLQVGLPANPVHCSLHPCVLGSEGSPSDYTWGELSLSGTPDRMVPDMGRPCALRLLFLGHELPGSGGAHPSFLTRPEDAPLLQLLRQWRSVASRSKLILPAAPGHKGCSRCDSTLPWVVFWPFHRIREGSFPSVAYSRAPQPSHY